MDVLRMERVRLDFPGNPGVLKDVSLRVPKGATVILQGRSGSGKSSLLTIAAGLLQPTAGRVTLMGRPLATDAEERANARAKHVGIVFQHLHLLPELTVRENIELPLRLRRVTKRASRDRAQALMQEFGLTVLADRLPTRLSGGEQQRVAIARALAPGPDLLLVDEPTSALDHENARSVIAALDVAARSGAGVLVATHDDLFAKDRRVLRIQDGRIQ